MFRIWRNGDVRRVVFVGHGAARFFYAAALTGRNICCLGLLDRPLTLGMLWGACTGDWSSAMLSAVFFEILWLDVYAVGSYIPPMPAFSFVVFLFLVQTFHCTNGLEFITALVISSVPAYIQPMMDATHRKIQIKKYNTLLFAAETSASLGSLPAKILFRSAFRQLTMGLICFFPVLLIAAGMYTAMQRFLFGMVPLSQLPGTYVVAAAALGATAVLRLKKAYAAFLLCIILFLL